MRPIGCYNKNSKHTMKRLVLCENCSAKLNSNPCKWMKKRDGATYLWHIEMW